jgi:predicted PurR-regulated permease PerM
MEPIIFARQRFLAGDVFIGVVVLTALYLGRAVLVPIALAVLLSFVLTPPVVRLRKLGLREMPAVIVVVVLAFVVVTSIAGVIGLQLTQLAGDLPRYQSTLEEKAGSIRSAVGGSGLAKSVRQFVQGIEKEVMRAPRAPEAPPPSTEPAATGASARFHPVAAARSPRSIDLGDGRARSASSDARY